MSWRWKESSAILMWGRSGSLLLASYLDGHEDVIMLPELCGWRLYEFFERFQSLPLRDKLIAYPAFEPDYTSVFRRRLRDLAGPVLCRGTSYS